MDPEVHPQTSYEPTTLDVLVTKAMIRKALGLPTEIIDHVVDLAEYWPHTTTEIDFGGSRAISRGSSSTENAFVIRSHPVGFPKPPTSNQQPDTYTTTKPQPVGLAAEHPVERFQQWIGSPDAVVAHPARKIVFITTSADQGWGGEGESGSYEKSWTWFEAGLERFDTEASAPENEAPIRAEALRPVAPPVVPADGNEKRFHLPLAGDPKLKIQRNRLATRQEKTHRVEWRYDDDVKADSEEAKALEDQGKSAPAFDGAFVRGLKLGDVVTVWAKSRFPAWANNVRKVKVEVYWVI